MYNRLDKLYQELFKAQEKHEPSSEEKIRKEINLELISIKESERNIRNFFKEMEGKLFLKNLKKLILNNDMNDVQISKVLSSLLTHSIIELEKKGHQCYSSLRIYEQSMVLSRFLGGDISAEEVYKYCKETFGKYL